MIARALFIFLVLAIGGGFIEEFIINRYYQGKRKKYKKYHFLFSRYIYLLLMPAVGALVSFFLVGSPVIEIFVIFALFGPVLEWLIGYAYHTIVGQRLWTYHRYAISGYTSWLTIPFWGLGGILFYFLAQLFY